MFDVPSLCGNVYRQELRGASPLLQALLVRARALLAIGGLDETIIAYQEWDTAIRLAKQFEFGFVPEPTFVYDCRGTDTISKNLLQAARGYEQILRKHLREIVLRVGPRAVSEHYRRLSSEYKMAGDEGASRRCRRLSYTWWPNPRKLTPVIRASGRSLRGLARIPPMVNAEDTQRGAKPCHLALDRDGKVSSSKPIIPRRAE